MTLRSSSESVSSGPPGQLLFVRRSGRRVLPRALHLLASHAQFGLGSRRPLDNRRFAHLLTAPAQGPVRRQSAVQVDRASNCRGRTGAIHRQRGCAPGAVVCTHGWLASVAAGADGTLVGGTYSLVMQYRALGHLPEWAAAHPAWLTWWDSSSRRWRSSSGDEHP